MKNLIVQNTFYFLQINHHMSALLEIDLRNPPFLHSHNMDPPQETIQSSTSCEQYRNFLHTATDTVLSRAIIVIFIDLLEKIQGYDLVMATEGVLNEI